MKAASTSSRRMIESAGASTMRCCRRSSVVPISLRLRGHIPYSSSPKSTRVLLEGAQNTRRLDGGHFKHGVSDVILNENILDTIIQKNIMIDVVPASEVMKLVFPHPGGPWRR